MTVEDREGRLFLWRRVKGIEFLCESKLSWLENRWRDFLLSRVKNKRRRVYLWYLFVILKDVGYQVSFTQYHVDVVSRRHNQRSILGTKGDDVSIRTTEKFLLILSETWIDKLLVETKWYQFSFTLCHVGVILLWEATKKFVKEQGRKKGEIDGLREHTNTIVINIDFLVGRRESEKLNGHRTTEEGWEHVRDNNKGKRRLCISAGRVRSPPFSQGLKTDACHRWKSAGPNETPRGNDMHKGWIQTKIVELWKVSLLRRAACVGVQRVHCYLCFWLILTFIQLPLTL